MRKLVAVLFAIVLLGIIIYRPEVGGIKATINNDDENAIVDIGDPQLKTVDVDDGGVIIDEESGGVIAELRTIDGFDSGGVIWDPDEPMQLKIIMAGVGSGCMRGDDTALADYPDGGELVADWARFAGGEGDTVIIDVMDGGGPVKPVFPVLMVADWAMIAPPGLWIGH